MRQTFRLRLPASDLTLGSRTLVMGVLNVTPDSFADGGRHLDPDEAVAAAHQMVADGADLIDIGGESTRPGAAPLPAAEEWSRVGPVIGRLAGTIGEFARTGQWAPSRR